MLIDKYGRDFTPWDVSRVWLDYQPKNAYCTAERVAFCNFVKGYNPPESAIYKNPYREWIGAQIRADYFGYINPGDPETAADMAWRDASISHIKNGIYGEMFAAAMIAAAASTDDIKTIIAAGLGEIPANCRLAEDVKLVVKMFDDGKTSEEVFAKIHEKWDEHSGSRLVPHDLERDDRRGRRSCTGGGDYGKSICLAVQTGFDTDWQRRDGRLNHRHEKRRQRNTRRMVQAAERQAVHIDLRCGNSENLGNGRKDPESSA